MFIEADKKITHKTWKPIDSNICHVWTECIKPQFEYKLSFGWWTGSYFRNGWPQEHFEDKCFLPFPNIYANSSLGKFKSREEKALEKGGIEDSGEKIEPQLSQLEYLHIQFLLSLHNSQQISQPLLYSLSLQHFLSCSHLPLPLRFYC